MANKGELRTRCWTALREAGAARFPGVEGRIPNFVGAEKAAKRLASHAAWEAAVVKANPDSPQRPVRHAALSAGKRVYMAVPKLAAVEPFIVLDPDALPDRALWHASSIKGAFELGEPVGLDAMEAIDLIVTGCVGVARDGARLGKGGGYSDLEYAILREHGLVTEATTIVTTVHESQVLRRNTIPMTDHDISLDFIVTPRRVISCDREFDRPAGILWDHLEPDKRNAIPVLRDR